MRVKELQLGDAKINYDNDPQHLPNSNHTSSLSNSYVSPFSSQRIQTLVFYFNESPQPDEDASHGISSTAQLETHKILILPQKRTLEVEEKLTDGFCPQFHGKIKPDKCPQWLDESIWKELWICWNSDAFKKRSDATKMSDASTMSVQLNPRELHLVVPTLQSKEKILMMSKEKFGLTQMVVFASFDQNVTLTQTLKVVFHPKPW
ncbi:hypothetical protein Cgig2_009796 [Carnegiea gigantea]|uniref:Uncharacterized protein n=1 Tax=Carnegiea gigantea TaxID=171969 RepID=A0A9Q1JMK9_9CARY|nr:hypothetical protein Cgig2_009796 [Carnegiea gigantea]